MRPLCYIAGPYTAPDPIVNTRTATLVAEEIQAAFDIGVFVPHLSMLWHLISPAEHSEWIARDLDVLDRCDALVRITGPSTGADIEEEYARGLGLPVFTLDATATRAPSSQLHIGIDDEDRVGGDSRFVAWRKGWTDAR